MREIHKKLNKMNPMNQNHAISNPSNPCDLSNSFMQPTFNPARRTWFKKNAPNLNTWIARARLSKISIPSTPTNAPWRILQTWLPPAINNSQTCAFKTRIGTTTKPMPFNAHTLTTCCAKSRATRHLCCEFSQPYEPKTPKRYNMYAPSQTCCIINPHFLQIWIHILREIQTIINMYGFLLCILVSCAVVFDKINDWHFFNQGVNHFKKKRIRKNMTCYRHNHRHSYALMLH